MTNDFGAETARLRELVDSHILNFLPRIDKRSNTLYEAMRYTLSARGKRVRPVLLLLTCAATGGTERDALPYACAVEYIHNYSLIHDDLPAMDDDDLRRGLATNHKVFGEAMAILAGDGLLSAAFETLHADYLKHLDAPEALRRRVLAGSAIADGCGCIGMVAGQVSDMEAEKNGCAGETLAYIHQNKTAALMRAAALAGARLGDGTEETVCALADYGERLGLAFQISDDLLDQTGDTAALGKTAGKDAKNGKATFTTLYGADAARARLDELTEQAAAFAEKSGAKPEYIGYFLEMARRLALRVN